MESDRSNAATGHFAWKLALCLAAGAALSVGPAVVEGRYLHRWGAGADWAEAAKAVQELPKSLGNWKCAASGEPLAGGVVTELGLESYISRSYRHPQTDQSVEVLLMAGLPGKLVRHPPNICYANQNLRQIGGVERISTEPAVAKSLVADAPGGQSDTDGQGSRGQSEFSVLLFEKPSSIVRSRFLVAYSHTVDGQWHVPVYPRLVFGGAPILYKVQVQTGLSPNAEVDGRDGLKDFLNEFTAVFARQLPKK